MLTFPFAEYTMCAIELQGQPGTQSPHLVKESQHQLNKQHSHRVDFFMRSYLQLFLYRYCFQLATNCFRTTFDFQKSTFSTLWPRHFLLQDSESKLFQHTQFGCVHRSAWTAAGTQSPHLVKKVQFQLNKQHSTELAFMKSFHLLFFSAFNFKCIHWQISNAFFLNQFRFAFSLPCAAVFVVLHAFFLVIS
jgi:hypothetical protein